MKTSKELSGFWFLVAVVVAMIIGSGSEVRANAPAADHGSGVGVLRCEDVGPLAAQEALQDGHAVFTLGDPAELRRELSVPDYAISDPGKPLIGYAVRRLPDGHYADIYVTRGTPEISEDVSAIVGWDPAEAAGADDEEVTRSAIRLWQTEPVTRSDDGPGSAWLFGQWTRWIQVVDYLCTDSPPLCAYALIDFKMYQLADRHVESEFFLCDMRIESKGEGTAALFTGSRWTTLDCDQYYPGPDTTEVLEHGPSTTVGSSSTSYTTGWSVSASTADLGGSYSSSVTHSWSTPCVSTVNRTAIPLGIVKWEEALGWCDQNCWPSIANFVSFPSAIFRVDDSTGGDQCGELTCKLRVDHLTEYGFWDHPSQDCIQAAVVLEWEDASIEWGRPQGPAITSFWPSQDPEAVNVGEYVNFAVTAAELNGCDLEYTWRLDGATVGNDPEYQFVASCFHPGAMTLEVVVSSGGGILTRRWLVRVEGDSRTPPQVPFVEVVGGENMIREGSQAVLRAGASGASDWSWEATCGTITGTGPEVIFEAPLVDSLTTCVVSVRAVNDCGASEATEVSFEVINTRFHEVDAGLLPLLGTASVDWGDFDNDGDLDLVGTTSYEDAVVIFRNDGGSFGLVWGSEVGDPSSASWGDYDNDGDLDILVVAAPSTIYRNDAGSFTDINAELGLALNGVGAWGDYDNDGDLDILLSPGSMQSSTTVFRNDDGQFVDIDAGLHGIEYGSVGWGDADNDGDLDILLASGTDFAAVYRNDGGTFVDMLVDFILPLSYSSAAWGDYDDDGDLDILLAGDIDHLAGFSTIYRNDGGDFVYDAEAGLPGVIQGSATFGDYDNDGDLDILLMDDGNASIHRNDGGVFVHDPWEQLTPLFQAAVAWGDYDNDGDLDLLSNGSDESNLYENETQVPNSPPTAPANLSGQLVGNQLTLTWDPATDDETVQAGLTYNVRVGTTVDGAEVLAPMADLVSGYRRVTRLGNVNHNLSWLITLPEPLEEEYFWSVQALDNCFEGSAFVSSPSSVTPSSTEAPSNFAIHPSDPNPFGPQTRIRFDVPAEGPLKLEIFNVLGQRVRILVNETLEPASYTRLWDGLDQRGRPVSDGIYFVKLGAGPTEVTRRVVRIR